MSCRIEKTAVFRQNQTTYPPAPDRQGVALTVTVPSPPRRFKISKPGYADNGKIFFGDLIEVNGRRCVELQRPDLAEQWIAAGWEPTARQSVPSIVLDFDWVYQVFTDTSESPRKKAKSRQ